MKNGFVKGVVIASLATLAACNSNTSRTAEANDGKVSTNLVNNPMSAEGMDKTAAEMKPVMTFNDTLHDFGAMHAGEVSQYEFAFTNTGKSPLIITAAAGSCGCTVPDFPHEAIAPGKGGVIKVTFNSTGKQGHQEKTVTVHTNTMRNTEMLYIKADVSPKS